MIDGSMQEFALTLDKFLDHAAKWHSRAQVVTGRDAGKVDRVSYADLKTRSCAFRRCCGISAWRRRARRDSRVEYAAHVETWYASWVSVRRATHSIRD
jgi:fatty-acyl-CoA synthase